MTKEELERRMRLENKMAYEHATSLAKITRNMDYFQKSTIDFLIEESRQLTTALELYKYFRFCV